MKNVDIAFIKAPFHLTHRAQTDEARKFISIASPPLLVRLHRPLAARVACPCSNQPWSTSNRRISCASNTPTFGAARECIRSYPKMPRELRPATTRAACRVTHASRRFLWSDCLQRTSRRDPSTAQPTNSLIGPLKCRGLELRTILASVVNHSDCSVSL